jgi:hypothetical protein
MKTKKVLAELVAQSIKDYEAYLNTLTPEQQIIRRNAFWSKVNINSKLVA